MRGRSLFLGVLTLAGVLLAGCNTIPRQNRGMEKFTVNSGYRYQNIAPAEKNSDSLLVILTFSGGGTRAAAFAYGTLEKLRDTEIVWEGKRRRLLDEVDVISSVSGGSLPAAYYGLFGDRIFTDFSDKVLYTNVQGKIVSQVLSPLFWPKLASPFYGRTDIMADYFSDKIFEQKTFSDLLARNTRPFIVLNATDVSLGSRFDFTQRQFDLLYSDLATYPVGNAVAASAAYPGMLTAMTIKNYEKKEDYVKPAWIDEELANGDTGRFRRRQAEQAKSYIEKGRPYIHLSDGGVSDNLGLLPVIQILGGAFPGDDTGSALDPSKCRKVLVITVNSKRASKADWDLKAEVTSFFKVLGVATSVPMSSFSDAQIQFMRQLVRQNQLGRSIRERVVKEYGQESLEKNFPEVAKPEPDVHYVEIEFDQMPDQAERDYLNAIPTAFKLKREQVDRLRSAAGTLLDNNADFKELLGELE